MGIKLQTRSGKLTTLATATRRQKYKRTNVQVRLSDTSLSLPEACKGASGESGVKLIGGDRGSVILHAPNSKVISICQHAPAPDISPFTARTSTKQMSFGWGFLPSAR